MSSGTYGAKTRAGTPCKRPPSERSCEGDDGGGGGDGGYCGVHGAGVVRDSFKRIVTTFHAYRILLS